MAETSSKRDIGFLYYWNEKRFIILKEGKFTIGRTEGDLTIEKDPALSRKHCLFDGKIREVTVTDLKSRNGVWINGTRVRAETPILLNEGDWIQVGRMNLFFTPTQTIPDITRTSMIPGIGSTTGSVSKTLMEEPEPPKGTGVKRIERPTPKRKS